MIPANTIQRNKPCPCGSGRKTKHCCINKIRDFQNDIEAGKTPQEIVVERILEEAASDV